jgi:hypothetical protein
MANPAPAIDVTKQLQRLSCGCLFVFPFGANKLTVFFIGIDALDDKLWELFLIVF